MQFRTKARAVDLLGKGQIADLPTAITELWKNGYDAYADHLTAEIYLDSYEGVDTPLFVMTDDGKGMSQHDILEKWLVLGTDSKSRAKLEDRESEETLWKKPRIKAGEKGIGRLSVAFLGNPMLMLTKKQGHPLQALFFDWRLLENYNLFLDDVNIPVASIEDFGDFKSIFSGLKESFLRNFESIIDEKGNSIWEDSQQELKTEIEQSVSKSSLPEFLIEKLTSDLLDVLNDHGTTFVIFEPMEQIVDLTSQSEDLLDDNRFVLSSLSGFTNQFIEDNEIVKTSIPIFKSVGNKIDFLTSEGSFFDYEDYDYADVLIEGDFDGKGSFEGTLKIYDKEIPYKYTNPRKKDKRSFYGSFPIKLGYSQGNESESKLSSIAWKKINDKVGNNGGLYIYRDNFRVLPYGRTDFDFLGFEKRRAIRAGSYYFSHRRMFGYIALTREKNGNLKDKSSREGLINNLAYRSFKNDLESFFKELAQEYFSTEAKQSIFTDKKELLKEEHQAIKLDEKRAKDEKKAFSRALSDYPQKLAYYQNEYQALLRKLEDKTQVVNVMYADIEETLDRIQQLDIEFKNLIPRVPKRYKPTELQLDRLSKYENKLIEFTETVKRDSARLMLKVQEKLEVKALKMEFTKNFQKYNGSIENLISQSRSTIKDKFELLLRDFSYRTRRIVDDLNFDKEKIISSIDSKESVVEQSNQLRSKFEFLRDQFDKEITPLVEHLNKLSFDIDEELVQGAYKAEYESIKYKWEQTRETAQLGVAVEIIDHEFNQLYSKINHSLSNLENENSISNNKQFLFLQQNFKQLEDKYNLLSPLYRISGATAKDVSGRDLYQYLVSFFDRRIVDYSIEIDCTDSFLNHRLFIKEPVIHTVFINIVNNAIYWMRNKDNRKIRFDYIEATEEITICNSGLKIEEHRLEKIFEIFYSNRPNGRGIGLYLAKQSLQENRLDIYATNNKEYNVLNGACFVIKPLL